MADSKATRIIGLLFVIIIGIFYVAKTAFFNSRKRLSIGEDSEFTYQKIAIGTIIGGLFVTIYLKFII
jgi:hypothetical protein